MTLRSALAVAVLVVFVAGAVAAVVGHGESGPGPAQARIQVDGTVVVTAVDGTTRSLVDATEIIGFGEQVQVEEGAAVLELAGGATYELRHHRDVGTVVEVGATPRVTAGDLLVVAGFPAAVAVDTATLTAQGALRVDAGESVASAYARRTRVTGVGDVTELMGLRRLVLVPGAVPQPVTFDGTDEWDRRHLGEAIAFGEQLQALARGYTSDLPPGAGRTVGFFRSVLPALADEREFGADLLDPSRSPGETLVGAAIVVQGRRGTFRERWDAVFGFRAAGAEWGLVALDQGVSSAPVLDTIELAIGASDGASGVDGAATAVAPRPPTPPSPSTTRTTEPDSPPTTGTTTTTTAPPEPPSDGGLLGPVIAPVSEVLGGVLDLLGLGPD